MKKIELNELEVGDYIIWINEGEEILEFGKVNRIKNKSVWMDLIILVGKRRTIHS